MRDKFGKGFSLGDQFFHDEHFEGHHHLKAGGYRRKKHHHGAKTFRRGRAIEFLNRLHVKRATLKQQLAAPELQSINHVLVGELKAIEMVINEFTQLFDIHEEEIEQYDSLTDGKDKSGEESATEDEETQSDQ